MFFKKYKILLELKNQELISTKKELERVNEDLIKSNNLFNELKLLLREKEILLEKNDIEIQDLKNKLESSQTENDIPKTENQNVFTTGESVYYKGLLDDDRWKIKSKNIKKIFSDKCYNCNCVKVNNIRDLYINWISDWDLILALEEIYNEKDKLISDLLEKKTNYSLYKIIQSWYNKKSFVYSYLLEPTDINPLLRTDAINCQIISSEDISKKNEIKIFEKKDFITKKYFIEINKGNIHQSINRLTYSYFDGITTEGKIFAHFKKHYSTSYSEAQGILFVDGFEIVFPLNYKYDSLTNLPNAKDVHHIVYPLSRMPWDSKNEDLVALCEGCHKKEHADNSIIIDS